MQTPKPTLRPWLISAALVIGLLICSALSEAEGTPQPTFDSSVARFQVRVTV
jgi:hypothetical protein